jgi:filamentous hemagglutinin
MIPVCAPFMPLVAGLTSAFVTGVTSGNLGLALRAGLIAGVTAYAMFEVGQLTSHGTLAFGTGTYYANVLGHALVGCVSAVASRGKCGAGALSGGAGSFI